MRLLRSNRNKRKTVGLPQRDELMPQNEPNVTLKRTPKNLLGIGVYFNAPMMNTRKAL